jgi:hypothetical protein
MGIMFPVDEQLDKDLLRCENYMLAIDQVIVCQGLKSFLSAFAILFAAFYVFNIEYPATASGTMEFIQRYEVFSP